MHLTYESARHLNSSKVFDPTPFSSSVPEYIDWRTMNAVTPVKRQVTTNKQKYQTSGAETVSKHTHTHTHTHRVSVGPVMPLPPLESLREPGLWLKECSNHSASKTSSTALVYTNNLDIVPS